MQPATRAFVPLPPPRCGAEEGGRPRAGRAGQVQGGGPQRALGTGYRTGTQTCLGGGWIWKTPSAGEVGVHRAGV